MYFLFWFSFFFHCIKISLHTIIFVRLYHISKAKGLGNAPDRIIQLQLERVLYVIDSMHIIYT
jgi:hypothetical protein